MRTRAGGDYADGSTLGSLLLQFLAVVVSVLGK